MEVHDEPEQNAPVPGQNAVGRRGAGPEPERLVFFLCVAEGSKLRVRITSPGYAPGANCQFPRAIRGAGRRYCAPADAVTLARGAGGTYFDRAKPAQVRLCDDDTAAAAAGLPRVARGEAAAGPSDPAAAAAADFSNLRVFGDEEYRQGKESECNICVVNVITHVIVCSESIEAITQKCRGGRDKPLCPLCRGPIAAVVDRALIK